MLKSEMQHQFWITKKTVQRKFGSKEDEHIISSDADLDAKIEVLKSIAETSADLNKIIDLYQERLCILSQEECVFGRFLKEVGKRSKTTGASIINTGKAVSYSGQQRMCVRVPLLRLEHEVEVFRNQAVRDTQYTIQNMEKERTEYRAALSWMKSASTELDPDNGKGLEKFRTAQSHVRMAKQNFDSLSMDSIQKIDLLAAARCNMYSHALVTYMTELKQFAQKTASTFETISASLTNKPKYDFCVLKDLTQDEGPVNQGQTISDLISVDKDQSLYISDEFVDKNEASGPNLQNTEDEKNENILIELQQQVEDDISTVDHLEDLQLQPQEQERTNFWTKIFNYNHLPLTSQSLSIPPLPETLENALNTCEQTSKPKNENRNVNQSTTKASAWVDLFAELDPLANPEAFDLKLNGGRKNFQQT